MKVLYRPTFTYPTTQRFSAPRMLRATPTPPALPVDILADENGYTLHADLPGFSTEQVAIEVLENRVTITAEKPESDDTIQPLWRERSHGGSKLQRTLALPAALNAEQAHADLKDGVLTLRLPLAESAKPRQVAIQA